MEEKYWQETIPVEDLSKPSFHPQTQIPANTSGTGIKSKISKKVSELQKCFHKFIYFEGYLIPVQIFIFSKKNFGNQRKDEYQKIVKILNQYNLPYQENLQNAKQYFQLSNCYFRVVTDIQNATEILQNPQLNIKVDAINIYNTSTLNQYQKFLQLKKQESSKVEAMFNSLDSYLQTIKPYLPYCKKQQQITNQQKNRFKNLLPAYFSSNQLSLKTTYTANLWASIQMVSNSPKNQKQVNIQITESLQSFKQFIDRLKKSLPQNKKDEINQKILNSYMNISRKGSYLTDENNLMLLMILYKSQSFYYNILNSMLRICRRISDFKPIRLPFAETYKAIKHFYNIFIENNQFKRPSLRLYRGCRLQDINNMIVGEIYELLGFVSTSTDEKEALQFMKDEDSCMLIINVKGRQLSSEELEEDHGFLSFEWLYNRQQFSNRFYELTGKKLENEKQVVLNSKTIVRLKSIETNGKMYSRVEVDLMTVPQLEKRYQQLKEEINKQQGGQKLSDEIRQNSQLKQSFQQLSQSHQSLLSGQNIVSNQIIQKYPLIPLNESNPQTIKQPHSMFSQSSTKVSSSNITKQSSSNTTKESITKQRSINSTEIKLRQSTIQKEILKTQKRPSQFQTKTLQLQQIYKVLVNYRYLQHLKNQIQDQGDLYRIYEEYNKQRDFYSKNFQDYLNTSNFTGIFKYIESQQKCGNVTQSYANIKNFLLKQSQNFSCLSHKNQQNFKKILILNQDSIFHRKILSRHIQNLIEKEKVDYDEIATVFYEKGESLFNDGNYPECLIALEQSKKRIMLREEQLKEQKLQVRQNKEDCFQFLTLILQSIGWMQPPVPLTNQENKEKQEKIKHNSLLLIQLQLKINDLTITCYSLDLSKKEQKTKTVKESRDLLQKYRENNVGSNQQPVQIKVLQARLISEELTKEKYPKNFQKLLETIKYFEQIDPVSYEVAQLRLVLATLQSNKISSSLTTPSQEFENEQINQDDQKLRQHAFKQGFKNQNAWNKKLYDQMIESVQSNYKRVLEIVAFKKGAHNPEYMKVSNEYSRFLQQNSKIKESMEQNMNVINSAVGAFHSEGAMAHLILSKNYLSRGQLKNALDELNFSNQILKESVMKGTKGDQQQMNEYVTYYKNSKLYIQIETLRMNVLHKLKRDSDSLQILKILSILESNIIKNLNQCVHTTCLTCICQTKAAIEASIAQTTPQTLTQNSTQIISQQKQPYEVEYNKAIQLVKSQIGQNNTKIADYYCSIAKTLIKDKKLLKQNRKNTIDKAKSYLNSAIQIYSKFPFNHPSNFIPFMTIYLLNSIKTKPTHKSHLPPINNPSIPTSQPIIQQTQNIQQPLKYSCHLVTYRYEKYHINNIKTKFYYCQFYSKNFPTKTQQIRKKWDQLDTTLKNIKSIQEFNKQLEKIQDSTKKDGFIKKMKIEDEKIIIKLEVNRNILKDVKKTN